METLITRLLKVFFPNMPETKNKPMRNIVQCGICGNVFKSAYDVKLHIKEAHVGKKPEAPKEEEKTDSSGTETPQGIVPETGTATEMQIVAPPAPELEPVNLQYKFFGFCSVCKCEPRTIMLDVGEGLYSVAFCSSCNKKLKQVKVVPLK